MGVLVLAPEDHWGLMSVEEGVTLMRQGFEDFSRSPIRLSNPRTRTQTAEGFRMAVHQGISPSAGGAFISGRGEKVEIRSDRQKLSGRGRPVFTLFDTGSAQLLMIMIGEPRPRGYEHVRAMAGFPTACTAAVGTQLMARPDAAKVGILGAKGQATFHLAALAVLRTLESVIVYSPTRENREAFARDMTRSLGFPVESVDDPHQVVRAAEILLCCTNSNVPVLDGRDLQPGAHVTSIVNSGKDLVKSGKLTKTRQEIDDQTLRRAMLSMTTDKLQEELDEPEVLYGATQRGILDWGDVIELSDLITGRVSVTEVHARKGITYFKNSSSWPLGFAALLGGIHDRAREAGVGLELKEVDGWEEPY